VQHAQAAATKSAAWINKTMKILGNRTRCGLSCAVVLALSSSAFAFDSLFRHVGKEAPLAELFKDSDAYAEVQHGVMLGTGRETWTRLPNGGLRIERSWRYTRARHPEHGTVHALPDPWVATGTLELTKNLRLVRSDTTTKFHKSADGVLDGYVISEEYDRLFEWNRASTVASKDGKSLTRITRLNDEIVDEDTYDYEPDAIPLELAGFYLSVAVHKKIDKFDFELLVPGGGQHGVRVEVHRTRDTRRYAQEYRLSKRYLDPQMDLAIVDMRLASPVKKFLFPYHFYMVFAAEDPTRLEMAWGGDPDDPMHALRAAGPIAP
jgi:hypothetical protein